MSTAQTPPLVEQLPPVSAVTPSSRTTAIRVVTPLRDPFAHAVPARPPATESAALAAVGAVPAKLGSLPPNLGAAGALPAVRVVAVATGSHPFALLDDGASTQLIAVGDAVAGRHVASIDGAGVHLDDGTLLPFAHDTAGQSLIGAEARP